MIGRKQADKPAGTVPRLGEGACLLPERVGRVRRPQTAPERQRLSEQFRFTERSERRRLAGKSNASPRRSPYRIRHLQQVPCAVDAVSLMQFGALEDVW